MRLQSLPDAVGDLVGGESILPQNVGSLAGLAELIVDADLAELAADLAHEHGGLGDAVADVLMGKVNCKFHKIGVNDRFGQSGKAADVLREYGLTADQIAETVKANI